MLQEPLRGEAVRLIKSCPCLYPCLCPHPCPFSPSFAPEGKTTVRIPYGDQKGLVLNAMGLIQHYEQREQWSIKSIIFNPMVSFRTTSPATLRGSIRTQGCKRNALKPDVLLCHPMLTPLVVH